MIEINVYYHKENYDYDGDFEFSLLLSEKYNTLTTLTFILIESKNVSFSFIKQIGGINIPSSFSYSNEYKDFMKVLNDSFGFSEIDKKSYFINYQNIWIMNKSIS